MFGSSGTHAPPPLQEQDAAGTVQEAAALSEAPLEAVCERWARLHDAESRVVHGSPAHGVALALDPEHGAERARDAELRGQRRARGERAVHH